MCLILFSYNSHPNYRLVVAANRDEFYERPSVPLHFWEDHPEVLAGRDLKSLGTWMGVTRSGRVAAITNYREPGVQIPDAPSRGHLISEFLIGNASVAAYLDRVKEAAWLYNGFNLLVGGTNELVYFSNRGNDVIHIESGIYGLSNHLLDTQWPKVKNGKKRLAQILEHHDTVPAKHLMNLLQNQDTAPDHQLPDTGAGTHWERTLSPIFITSPNYGTRCSTILTIDRSNLVKVIEHTWQQSQLKPVLQQKHEFDFMIEP